MRLIVMDKWTCVVYYVVVVVEGQAMLCYVHLFLPCLCIVLGKAGTHISVVNRYREIT